MHRQIATFFGIGHLRPASGTWASVAAVVLAVVAYQLGLALLVPVLAAVATVLGFWAVPLYLRDRPGDSDPSEVVIDEVAGQWIAMSFTVMPLWRHDVADIFLDAWPGWVVPLVLFRLFDIWKPWIIGRADRRGDATGVMLDDLIAGVFAGIGSVVLAGLYHGVLERFL